MGMAEALKKVLIVEDDKEQQTGIRHLLEQHIGQRNVQYSARFLERFPTLLPVGAVVHIQERDLGCRRDGLFENLQVLPVDFVSRGHRDAGNVPGWARKARHLSQFRISPRADDRYRAGCCADRVHNGRADRNDHIGVPADDLASEIGITLGAALTGIALDGEILSLDVAEPTQLFENRLIKPTAPGVAYASDGTRRNDDGDPVLLIRLLRRTDRAPAASNRPAVKSRRLIR